MADQNINNMTVTWNAGGTTFASVKMNVTDTASAAASLLLQFQVGGSDKFKVGKDGTITGAGNLSIAGNATITGNVTITGTLTAGGLAGTVTGPASSTDNAVARWNGTTGGVVQNSGVTIDDSNNVSAAGYIWGRSIGTGGVAFKVGNDASIDDVDVAHCLGIKSQTDTSKGFVRFGNSGSFGFDGTKIVVNNNTAITGTLSATGDITYSSDERLKTNIRPLDRAAAVEMVRSVNPVSFNRISDASRSIGFIAQDVEKWEPALVNKDEQGYLSLAYGNMVAVLWEAVKDLQDRIAVSKAGA